MHNVLIVEDELLIGRSLQKYLMKYYKSVVHVQSYQEGLERACECGPDIICIDIHLGPGKSGLELCKAIREHNPTIPIIVITAQPLEEYLESTLNLELTDYVSKPYHPEEIRIRMQHLFTLQKKIVPKVTQETYIEQIAEDFSINHAHSKICIAGEEKHVPKTLKQLLDLLIQHKNTIVSHQYLHEKIWGDYFNIEKKREIRAHTKRLRQILGPKYGPKLQNVKAQGYIFMC